MIEEIKILEAISKIPKHDFHAGQQDEGQIVFYFVLMPDQGSSKVKEPGKKALQFPPFL